MSQETDISPEDFLKNIADELTTISGECTEIKQAQLTAATTDDLNNMGTSIASAVIEKVNTMQSYIDAHTQTVSAIGDNLTDSVKSMTDSVTEKLTILRLIHQCKRSKRLSASHANHGSGISLLDSLSSPLSCFSQ